MVDCHDLVEAGYGDARVMWRGNEQRDSSGVLSWDETFMALARMVAKRSKDPSTQVGAVIVDRNNRILSLGYNGAPIGFDDEDFPWGKNAESPLGNKYMYVVHAEQNAILNYRGSRNDLEDARVYVTLSPCNECAKAIIQSGIRTVMYGDEPEHPGDMDRASHLMLQRCGVTVQRYAPSGRTISIDI